MKKWFSKCIAALLAGAIMVSSVQYSAVQSAAKEMSEQEIKTLINGSFETTLKDTTGNIGKYWDEGMYPQAWKEMWVAKAPEAGKVSKFNIETSKENIVEGNNSVHYYSNDSKSRFEIYTMINDIDLSKEYIYRAKIKTKNVAGTGCYLRAQTLTSQGVLEDINHKNNLRIKGTTDGFTIYEIPIKITKPGATRLKLEIFFEYLSGDVWVDCVELVETYSISLDTKFKQVAPGDQFNITPILSQEVGGPEIKWTSSQESIAAVSGGAIEAKSTGFTTITAKIDENLYAECEVLVYGDDAGSSYEDIRNRWSDRLTGNNITNPNDVDYIKTMEALENNADTVLSQYIKKPIGTDNRTTIFEDLNLTIKFEASSDASKSQPFQTAFDRIKTMALAYSSKGSKYYKSEDLKQSIIESLEWMYNNVYNERYDIKTKLYGNWWHWQIGMPQALCDIVILMYNDLPIELIEKEADTLERFNKNPNIVYKIANYGTMAATSANLMDTAIVSALKSAISGEHLGIGYAQEALSKVLPYVNSGDGFYEDGSCVQHTNLAYTGGYGAMDKVVHHGENFSLGISMYSKRIASFEYGNKENKKGWHMSDGALYLYNGDQKQYAENYWSTVDPMRLAGITTDHTEGTISDSSWMAHVSNKTFVGGSVVDNKYGATAMDFEIENSTLNGKKSWFSFDDEIVCLGAGINSTNDKFTETIIDNRKIKDTNDNIIIINGEPLKLDTNIIQGIKNANWGLLSGNNPDGKDTVGYYFPEPASIEILKETRTGRFLDINGSLSSTSPDATPVTKNYMSLSVSHGNMSKDEKYNYVLLPNKTENQMKEYANNPDIKILSNTADIQSAEDTKIGVKGINFFAAGTLGNITAKQPCSIVTYDKNGIYKLAISDPAQTNNLIEIELDEKTNYKLVSKDENVLVNLANGKYTISVNTNNSHGASFQVEWKEEKYNL